MRVHGLRAIDFNRIKSRKLITSTKKKTPSTHNDDSLVHWIARLANVRHISA